MIGLKEGICPPRERIRIDEGKLNELTEGEISAGKEVVESLIGNCGEEELVKTMFIDKRSIVRRKTGINRDI